MRDRDRKIAERFGFLSKVEAFEKELLRIDGVVAESNEDGIDFELNGWLSDIRHVIIIPKYRYYDYPHDLVTKILETAARFGLSRTEDRIEDQGAHFYIVLLCDETWPRIEA